MKRLKYYWLVIKLKAYMMAVNHLMHKEVCFDYCMLKEIERKHNEK